MKKIFVLFVLSIFLVSCWNKNNNEFEKKEINNIQEKKQIHTKLKPKTPEQKYWKLAKYIKQDLTLKEEQELQNLLNQRRELILKIKKELIEANRQWYFEEKMLQVEKQREEMMNKILPYVIEEKKEEFKKSYEKWNELLRKILKQK